MAAFTAGPLFVYTKNRLSCIVEYACQDLVKCNVWRPAPRANRFPNHRPPHNQLPDKKESGATQDGVARARVWTRKRLAELCGISEQQVVEWAILMGNDYTREVSFPAIGFGKHRQRRPEKVSGFRLAFYLFIFTGGETHSGGLAALGLERGGGGREVPVEPFYFFFL